MLVADVGAGRGELIVALAAENRAQWAGVFDCRWRSFTHDRHRRTTGASAPRRKLSVIVMVVVDTAGDSLFGEFDSGGHRS
jgi:hypothetical protein